MRAMARLRRGPAMGAMAAIAGVGLMLSLPASGQNPARFDLPAPKLVGEAKDWINTGGKSLDYEKGKVYVVQFWTFG